MAMATHDPLAPGVYSMDVSRPFGSSSAPDQDPYFQDWVAFGLGAVRVTQRSTSTNVIPGTGADGSNHDRVLVHYVFEVLPAPAPSPPNFPREHIGSPTIEKLGDVTPADRNPPAPDGTIDTTRPSGAPGDWLQEQVNKVAAAVRNVGPELVIGGVCLWIVLEQSKGSRRSSSA